MPLFCNQNNGGAQIMAIKQDRKNGTSMDSAVRMPAIIMIQAANIKMPLAIVDKVWVDKFWVDEPWFDCFDVVIIYPLSEAQI